MTRWLIGVALALSLPQLRASDDGAEANDPIAAKVKNARDAYLKSKEKVNTEAWDGLEKAESLAKKQENLELVKRIRTDKDAFKLKGIIPAYALTSDQRRRFGKSRDAFVEALVVATRQYTRAGRIDEAEKLDKERKTLVRRSSRIKVTNSKRPLADLLSRTQRLATEFNRSPVKLARSTTQAGSTMEARRGRSSIAPSTEGDRSRLLSAGAKLSKAGMRARRR